MESFFDGSWYSVIGVPGAKRHLYMKSEMAPSQADTNVQIQFPDSAGSERLTFRVLTD